MKRLVFSILGMLVFALPTTGIAAKAKVKGVVSSHHGTFIQDIDESNSARCPISGVCAGDLVTCADGEIISITTTLITFLDKLCDDTDPAVADCDGRFTSLSESCVVPLTPGPTPINEVTAFPETRTCFDPAATSAVPADCTGSVADLEAAGVSVVYTNTLRNHARGDFYSEGEYHLVAEQIGGTAKQFVDNTDGKKKEFIPEVYICENTAQTNHLFDNCLAANGTEGCGFAGVCFRGR